MPNVLLYYSLHLLLSHAALTLSFFFFSLAHAIIKIFLSNCFLFLYVRSGEGERETGHSRRPGIVQAEFEQGSKGAGGHTALAITMSASSFVAPEP